ncbi:hypothetical protein QF042_003559 [Pedobacter sp. W3I1]|uniref:hypothetical protein n=1 Tax=Pedobacter sp. W3I1 TaxID=3042291 RepID=UPI0027878D4B|nr:hypothetical protein [Pedobacter sp. W3I1]MDQ0639994.1 hypothetical protein [Pedobacter sp. W3I1]
MDRNDFWDHSQPGTGPLLTSQLLSYAEELMGFSINGFNPITYGLLPIEKIVEDDQSSKIVFGKKVPLAYDSGGNVFLISEEGQIYIIA